MVIVVALPAGETGLIVRPPLPEITLLRVKDWVTLMIPSAVPKFNAALTVPPTLVVGEKRNAPLVIVIGPPERVEVETGAKSRAFTVELAGAIVVPVNRTLSVAVELARDERYSVEARGRNLPVAES